jgi:hypothetical protein
MGSILHISSQLDVERSYLHPRAVFRLIERGEPVPLGELGDRRWAVAHAITIVESDEDRWPATPASRAGADMPEADPSRSPGRPLSVA